MRHRVSVRVRIGLSGTTAPPAGVVDPPFHWSDVLYSPRPGERERGPPVRCVPGFELLAAAERVENPLLFVVRAHGDIEIEDRLCVTTRALGGAIETERATVGVRLEEARAAARQRARAARAGAEAHAREGSAAFAAAQHARAWWHHALARILTGSRALTRGVVSLPDRAIARSRRAAALLSTPEGRAIVRRGLADPTPLTPEQKGVTLTVGAVLIVAMLAFVHFGVTLAVPQLAVAWRTVLFLFGYAFVTSFGIPAPIEPPLLVAALHVGPIAAIVSALVAKVLAAWMVLFVGDEIYDRLRARAARSERLTRILAASERFARRHGLWAVAVLIATPGLPDAVALYVFGSLQMRMRHFLAGVAIGGLVLYSALTLGLLHVASWF